MALWEVTEGRQGDHRGDHGNEHDIGKYIGNREVGKYLGE